MNFFVIKGRVNKTVLQDNMLPDPPISTAQASHKTPSKYLSAVPPKDDSKGIASLITKNKRNDIPEKLDGESKTVAMALPFTTSTDARRGGSKCTLSLIT